MEAPLRERFERLTRRVAPSVLTTVMALLCAVPLHAPGLGRIMPAFTLINIYYWGVFAPGALPYTLLFVLGLLQDALLGLPLGTTSLVNVCFAAVLIVERRYFGKTLFSTVWLGFVLLSLAAVVFELGVLSLFHMQLLPFAAAFLQWIATALAYPLLHLFLTHVYRGMHVSP